MTDNAVRWQVRTRLRRQDGTHYKVKGVAYQRDNGEIEIVLHKGEAILPEKDIVIYLTPLSED